ncbi:hypothetical protein GOBAR_AA26253 [Gossypium barbadense]|uniref:Uncharacterized protein n=1 Tax=Gossypium barbadense TaxID=3634 RepID=A0A2P5WTL3_GOSBA|nr:hypothetical protein GOBAR_AA26253 [Gossypium barbadense]
MAFLPLDDDIMYLKMGGPHGLGPHPCTLKTITFNFQCVVRIVSLKGKCFVSYVKRELTSSARLLVLSVRCSSNMSYSF